ELRPRDQHHARRVVVDRGGVHRQGTLAGKGAPQPTAALLVQQEAGGTQVARPGQAPDDDERDGDQPARQRGNHPGHQHPSSFPPAPPPPPPKSGGYAPAPHGTDPQLTRASHNGGQAKRKDGGEPGSPPSSCPGAASAATPIWPRALRTD